MKKLKALLDLIRFGHGLMLIIAILIGAVIAYQGVPEDWLSLTLAFSTALCLEISTFSLNDYFDYKIDKMNKRFDRPLVRGDIKPVTAFLISVIFFPLGILSAYFVNMTCFIIAVITGLFALAYDVKLKKIKLLGNYYIAYTMAIPFIFGGVVYSESIPLIIVMLALVAFLSGVGREIMKDVMDLSGDKLDQVSSLPMYIGKRYSLILSGIFYMSAVVVSFIPFLMKVDPSYFRNNIYLILVSIPAFLFISVTYMIIIKENPNLKLLRKVTLLAMILGLVAFLGGAFC